MKRAFQAKKIGDTTLKNSFIKTATFEGMYKDSIPTQQLIDHHASMAKGGVALTTVAYGAVSHDARSFKHQMFINDKSLEKLKQLAEAVHQLSLIHI